MSGKKEVFMSNIPRVNASTILFTCMCGLSSYFAVRASRSSNPIDIIYALGCLASVGAILRLTTRDVEIRDPQGQDGVLRNLAARNLAHRTE